MRLAGHVIPHFISIIAASDMYIWLAQRSERASNEREVAGSIPVLDIVGGMASGFPFWFIATLEKTHGVLPLPPSRYHEGFTPSRVAGLVNPPPPLAPRIEPSPPPPPPPPYRELIIVSILHTRIAPSSCACRLSLLPPPLRIW